MIRVQSFEADNLIPLLSGLITEETTGDSYVFINTLLKLLPPEEAVQESYLIMATLDQMYMIYSRSKLIPNLNKESLLSTIENNIYEELKENKYAGFQQYARTMCQVELDLYNEEVIGTVANTLLDSIESIIDQAIELQYTLNQSVSEIMNFQTNYKHSLVRESGRLLEMLSNSDMSQVGLHFWGWNYFMRRHRIYGVNDVVNFLNLVADFANVKDKWSMMADSPLTSIDQIIAYEEKYLENLDPIMSVPFPDFNETVKFKKEQSSVLVASKSVGKTTFASMLAGIALAQGLRVLFYSPEMPAPILMNENILLPYIRAKYGFTVTTPQVLGLEEPFEAGSEYTAEEKKVLIGMAKQELADSGAFMHITEYLEYKTMESDFRAYVKSHQPDIIFFDHTQEIRGDASLHDKTSRTATMTKSVNKDYGTHTFLLSHPGGKFAEAIPTIEKPINRDIKINAYSNDVETLADNIMGAVRDGENKFKVFYTKLRYGNIPPMFQVFRMIKPQGWFEFRKEDQYIQTTDSDDAVNALLEGRSILIEDYDDNEDDDNDF